MKKHILPKCLLLGILANIILLLQIAVNGYYCSETTTVFNEIDSTLTNELENYEEEELLNIIGMEVSDINANPDVLTFMNTINEEAVSIDEYEKSNK